MKDKRLLYWLVGIFCLFIVTGLVAWRWQVFRPGKVLNIYCWDIDFKQLLASYYPAYDAETERIGDVQVNWVIVPNLSNTYQAVLDRALAAQQKVPDDERIDIFLVEADNLRRYTSAPRYAMSLSELGLTDEEMSQQFPYAKRAADDGDGWQRGISWQANPGVMIYRRSIARQVFGTDDPAQIQPLVEDWERFDQAAARVQQAGFFMLAGEFDTYRPFMARRMTGWVDAARAIHLDPVISSWIDYTRRSVREGKAMPNALWSPAWMEQMQQQGKTFCFFGPSWFINDVLAPQAKGRRNKEDIDTGTFGDWAVCRGPQPYLWGGTWICAANGTDNVGLAADIMRTLCCDPATLRRMASEEHIFVNHRAIMQEMAQGEGVPVLGGQNPFGTMLLVAEQMPNPLWQLTPYDQGAHEAFQAACRDYFAERMTKDTAWQHFLATVWLRYPELQSAAIVQ